ncbi:MAG TPA: MarR family winged helix-turn-helix transcriptional regulator [Polyangiaceae bacterium]|nr:MarR family winged helix-turn-helix transcriptional regulator [Polyangiaceae bacterium]
MKPTPFDPLPEVAPLRHASREVVRALGLLGDCLPEFGLTPSQAHALIELERGGELTSGELAERLRLDKSTASRLSAQLAERGYVAASGAGADRRRKPLRLTAKGRARVAAVHARADRQVHEALSLLDEADRRRVVEGMALYARALARLERRRGYEVRPLARRDDPAVAAIIRAVMTEFGASGPGFAIHDPEVDAMYDAYRPPRAGYLVIEREGRVVGGGGFGPLAGGDAGVCELRKMYFLPETRGLGLGRLLLDRVQQAAREAGYHTMYLETLGTMRRARQLYEAARFRKLSGPMGSTGHFGCDAWYAKALREEAPPLNEAGAGGACAGGAGATPGEARAGEAGATPGEARAGGASAAPGEARAGAAGATPGEARADEAPAG